MSTETKQPELTESVASVAAESAEELLPEDTIDDQQLPFGFAKRHKVLLELNQEPALLYHTSDTPLEIFSEVRRYHAGALVLKELPQDQFEPLLTQAYQRDSSAAKQLMEDLGIKPLR